MPVVLWPRHPYAKWLMAGFLILWTGLLWVISLNDQRTWAAQLYWLFFPLQMYTTVLNLRYVLDGGTLAVVRGAMIQRVPLALTALERTGARLRLRWPDGRRMRAVKLTAPVPFAAAVEQAAQSASAAPAETPQPSAFGFPISRNAGPWGIGALVAVIGLFALAFWQNQPLFLLPLALLPLLGERAGAGRLLLLSGDTLWLLISGQEPHPIPLSRLHDSLPGRKPEVLVTSDPAYPEIRLNRYQSRDLLRQLQHRRQGAPTLQRG